jgi:hypothetical protein
MKCIRWEMPKRSPEARYRQGQSSMAKDRFFISDDTTRPDIVSPIRRTDTGANIANSGGFTKVGPQNMVVGSPEGPGPTPAGTGGPGSLVVLGRFGISRNENPGLVTENFDGACSHECLAFPFRQTSPEGAQA